MAPCKWVPFSYVNGARSALMEMVANETEKMQYFFIQVPPEMTTMPSWLCDPDDLWDTAVRPDFLEINNYSWHIGDINRICRSVKHQDQRLVRVVRFRACSFCPFRKLRMQIQEGTKVATEPLIARNRTGKALDAHFIDKGLHAEDHTSVITHGITTSAFESRAMEDLNEIHKCVKESLELARQMYDRLILIQSKTEAILMQQLELSEYQMFIVLPEVPAKYDPGN